MENESIAVFGSALTAIRKASGLTAKQVADRIGVTKAAYSQWENGKRRCTKSNFDDLVIVLGLKDDGNAIRFDGAHRQENLNDDERNKVSS